MVGLTQPSRTFMRPLIAPCESSQRSPATPLFLGAVEEATFQRNVESRACDTTVRERNSSEPYDATYSGGSLEPRLTDVVRAQYRGRPCEAAVAAAVGGYSRYVVLGGSGGGRRGCVVLEEQ